MSLPDFDESGDLPVGVHRAPMSEVLARFGSATTRRRALALRVQRLYQLASSTGHLARFVLFGSFVTAKDEPGDIDIFLLMADSFDVSQVVGEAELLFDHLAADAHFGASVFWLRRLAALGGEQTTVEYWQTTREGGRRGIVEIFSEAS